jgi:hypothetical protein
MSYKYPNVSVDFGTKTSPGMTFIFHPMLADLLDTLAIKYSSWQFVGTEGKYADEARTQIRVHTMVVLNDENPRVDVGTVRITNRYHRDKGTQLTYSIYNGRIANSRERGHTVTTIDKKLALKTIAKYFTAVPVTERLNDALHDAQQRVSRTYQHVASRIHIKVGTAFPYMKSYIYKHWDDFLATVPESTVPIMREMLALEAELAQLESLKNPSGSGQVSLTVLTEHDKYTVLHNGRISVWDAHALPTEVRQAIGMLKLSEIGAVVPEVGVRMTSSTFSITVPSKCVGQW